jgi:acyl-CoA oxidase
MSAVAVDVDTLHRLLLGRWAEERLFTRELVRDPRFGRDLSLGMPQHRERVLEQLRMIVASGGGLRAFPKRFGGEDDPGGNVAAYEDLVLADPSLQIKAGVQFGLFGAAVLQLGTAEHHDRWLNAITSLDVLGAFAMTETGHGSDVASIATTATYDPAAEEFVIHTPFRAAWKDYLGNAAVHAAAAVVFAQLISAGVNHGVHCFYVPIRDGEGRFLPGITGEDDGLKGGLNGIDNGRLCFDQVRVPRNNLLNRYGDVAADGTYSSLIASPGRRFFTMLGTLVQGRVSLDGAVTSAAKAGLAIAVRYGNERRQFAGASDVEEVTILDYQEHQRRLLPLLAATYAQAFAHEELLTLFEIVFSGVADSEVNREGLETMAAAMKATSTWLAVEVLQTAREACGGQGYLAENRIVGLRADLDVYVTFEGDNTVLLQLVAKRLLADYNREFAHGDMPGVARYVASRATDATLHRTPLYRMAESLRDAGSHRRAAGQLREAAVQRELLRERVEAMVADLAAALRPATRAPRDKAAEIVNQHQHELVELGKAHADYVRWRAFTKALATIEDPDTRRVLTWLRDLYGLTTIEKNLAWYLVNGRISSQRARTLSSYVNRLLVRLRPHAVDLVDAFGYDDAMLRAPIASGAEAVRQEEARAYHRRLRASGDAPIPEKSLAAKSLKPAKAS